MRVVVDTNVLVQLFGKLSPFTPLKNAIFAGQIELAISTSIFLEYEEVISRYGGAKRWEQVSRALDLISALHNTVRHVEPSFRFHAILTDPDDNAFVDCAIAAAARFIITEDRHFDVMVGVGFEPRPITPKDFITAHLQQP